MTKFTAATIGLATLGALVSASADPCANPLLSPALCCNATAPETFRVRFDTTVGPFSIAIQRSWSPAGVDQFYNLAVCHYYGEYQTVLQQGCT
jgi:peptidyl-prolyl cis-trans isomerase A (cyclophilin A)